MFTKRKNMGNEVLKEGLTIIHFVINEKLNNY